MSDEGWELVYTKGEVSSFRFIFQNRMPSKQLNIIPNDRKQAPKYESFIKERVRIKASPETIAAYAVDIGTEFIHPSDS